MSEKAEGGLMPCPFCGGAVEDVGGGAIWHVVREGYVTCPIVSYGIARESWNRRSLQSLSPEREAVIEECAELADQLCMVSAAVPVATTTINRLAHELRDKLRVLKSAAGNEEMDPDDISMPFSGSMERKV